MNRQQQDRLKQQKPGIQKNLKDKEKPSFKLPEDMENEIKDAFNFYDQEKIGQINRTQLRSILGNFSFTNMNVKEIEEEIKSEYPNNPTKNQFQYEDVINLIQQKWYYGGGREAEASEIFKLFDRKGKSGVGLNEIRHLFSQYLDIPISDADIMEFIQEADLDGDSMLNKEEFCAKLGYI